MRNLIIILGIFVLMATAQLKVTPDAEAGVSMPDIFATLVCHYNNNKKTYKVVLVDLPGDMEEVCELPPYCDINETCADCLSVLISMGFDIDKSNEVTNIRVVYTLNAEYPYPECFVD